MHRDFIMRLIEQVAALLASAIAKERAGLHSQARTDLEEKARQTIGMGLADVRRLSPEAVSELLASSGGLRYGRSVILAELLLHDAANSPGGEESADAFLNHLHAFCLLSDAVDKLAEEDQAVYRPKLQALAARLKGRPAHPYVSVKLTEYEART